MNWKIRKWLLISIILTGFSCSSDSDIEVYEKKGSKVFEKYIFRMNGKYFFADGRDPSGISEIGRNKVLVDQDILFKRLNDLSEQVNGPFSLEASSYESSLRDSLNFDLRFSNNELFVRLYDIQKPAATYQIDLDQKYIDLLKKAVNNFAQKRGGHHRTSKTENTVTFAIRLNGRNFRRSKSIHDDDVLLLYGAIRFILKENLKDKEKIRVIPDTLQVQTVEKYARVRAQAL